ncbi:MAG: hypothetical protein V4574_09210 [Pseudomonadota bacterium]
MNPLLLPVCALGIHHRSHKSVWRDGTHYRATCAGCGTPMVRDANGWHRDRKQP